MSLVKACPSCDGRMLPGGARESLRSFIRNIRNPRQGKCPHCGAVFQGSFDYWLVTHIGGVITAIGSLGLLGLTVDLISPTYTLGAFVVTGLGIGIMYFGLWRIRVEKVGE